MAPLLRRLAAIALAVGCAEAFSVPGVRTLPLGPTARTAALRAPARGASGICSAAPRPLGALSMQEQPADGGPAGDAALTLLRVAAGVLMIHHGSEGGVGPANIGTEAFNGFVEFVMKPYFSWLPGSLVAWAAVHDVAEFAGGILLALGAFTRYTAAVLTGTMAMAVYFHLASSGLEGFPLGHVKNYSYNFEEPALYLCIFCLFAVTGGGPFSIDSLIQNKDE